jgi:hypothetical protein
MRNSFVYFMVDANASTARFKVGYSENPYERSQHLGAKIDFKRSRMAACSFEEGARFEHRFHSAFFEFRIPSPNGSGRQGHTEWFRIECLDTMLAEVESVLGDLLPIKKTHTNLRITISNELHRQIKISCAQNKTTVQDAIHAIVTAQYGDY